ncbi:MAG: hypothetical protein RLP44_01850 [Aggregatilineales bacterium]
MNEQEIKLNEDSLNGEINLAPEKRTNAQGQSLIEYALILMLLGIALGLAIAAAGPAVGNTFENVVFNLLQQTPEDSDPVVGGPVEFWLTVTWLAQNPQGEQRLPTRTPAQPSTTPTFGPSPTPSATFATNTPVPSNTPIPTPLPPDITVVAPWTDPSDPYANTVANPEHWRVDDTTFLGYGKWCGDYYQTTNLTGSSTRVCNEQLGIPGNTLDFNWGQGSPIANWPAANPGDRFSTRYYRDIYIGETMTLTFIVGGDDGYRLWMNYADGCAASGGVSNAPNSGDNATGDRTFGGNATHCLLIDDWNGQSYEVDTVTRTFVVEDPEDVPGTLFPPRIIRLQLDYQELSGDARIMAIVTGGGSNPDDTAVDNNGVPVAQGAVCNWGRDESTNSNTLEWQWEEYVNGDMGQNSRCYLEFRGAVHIPNGSATDPPGATPMTAPEMVFWDVWDFDSNRIYGWLEIAEYQEVSPGIADRAAMNWQRINLRQGSNQNYNWTRNVVDLTNVNGINFLGKRVAFRFAMEVRNTGSTRNWWIDDVSFRDRTIRGLNGVAPFTIDNNTDDTLNRSYWNLNVDTQVGDFITTPQWRLTGNSNARADGGCCSWEDTPASEIYREHTQGPNTWNLYDARVHFVEFNGFIDVSGNTPDYQGDTGAPMLSFYNAYVLGRYTGLEIQYTTDAYGIGPANWRVVPGIDPNDPYGRIRNWGENSDVNRTSMNFEEVSLAEIPATRFRLRFAMMVRGDAGLRDGWWIDTIRLEREGLPTYLDYPFFDSAEVGMDNWLAGGNWWRTNEIAREGGHSFTDSPGVGVQYDVNSNSTLRFSDPIDMFNDTPRNLALLDRNPAGGNTQVTPANDPVMTFWHRRRLQRYDNFHVEWRRYNETDSEWRPLWSYNFAMNTTSNDSNWRSQYQDAWERVEIDLSPMMDILAAGNTAATDDDDIMIRFRLYSDGSYTDEGVWIDSVEIRDRVETTYKLWPISQTRSVGGTSYGTGSGLRFGDDVDSNEWWTRWYAGGGWLAIEWEQNSGLRAFHESTNQQIAAPYTPAVSYNPITDLWTATPVNVTADPANIQFTQTPDDTFNVLELSTIIDLRATDVVDRPILYFWNRFHTGRSDRISVEISYELDPATTNIANRMNTWCGGNRPNCYEHVYGWSEWQEVWYKGQFERTWTWQREQISLESFAATGLSAGSTPGKRIKVRFVYDSLDNADNRDGWYIDDLAIEYANRQVLATIGTATSGSGSFFDNARNLNNWVTEGEWGLSPELFRGVGGGPASLGIWRETWWNCDNCANLVPNGSNRYARGTDAFLDSDGSAIPAYTPTSRNVLEIGYDMGGGRPSDISGTFNERDTFVGRWELDTPLVGTGGVTAGDYSFITVSDDGVRMKIEEIDAAGNLLFPLPPNVTDLVEWNVIYNWNDHGRVADMGTVTLETGRRYRITLEYYEGSGSATIVLSTGGTSFSFTDSPKQGAGPAFLDRPSVPYSNSSLIMDGVLDLTGATNPILQFYSYHEIDGTARVEISIDGGFTWTSNGLRDNIVDGSGTVTDSSFDDPTFGGTYVPGQSGVTGWNQRRYNLTRYADQQLMVRFRFDRQNRGGNNDLGDDRMSIDSTTNINSTNYNNNGYFVGWWIVDIQVAQ